jgi:hypothetical protein
MALIIEDGTQPLNANTYASVSDLGSYAALRGLSLPGSTSQQEHLLIRAMDWLEAQSHRYKGYRKTQEQLLCWPRNLVILHNVELYTTDNTIANGNENLLTVQYFPNNKIPKQLIYAQCQLAVDAHTVSLMPTVANATNFNLKKSKVGPIEDEYFGAKDARSVRPTLLQAEGWIADLVDGGGFGLTLKRA